MYPVQLFPDNFQFHRNLLSILIARGCYCEKARLECQFWADRLQFWPLPPDDRPRDKAELTTPAVPSSCRRFRGNR